MIFYCCLHLCRHLKEISELQANQRGEVELLYHRLGKNPPPGLSHTAPPTGRRRKSSKHKLKAGKLLSPLVQQFKNVTTKSSDSNKASKYLLKNIYRETATLCVCNVYTLCKTCVFNSITECVQPNVTQSDMSALCLRVDPGVSVRCRWRRAGGEFERVSGQSGLPSHAQPDPVGHRPPAQPAPGARSDPAALLSQGLPVVR